MMSGWFGGQKTRQNADVTTSSGDSVQKRGTSATDVTSRCDEDANDLDKCATDYDSNGNELVQHVHQSPNPYRVHGTPQRTNKSGSDDTSDLSDSGTIQSGIRTPQQSTFDSYQYDTPSRTHRRKRAIERARRERSMRQRAAGQPPVVPRPIISSTGMQSFPGVRIDASSGSSNPQNANADDQSGMSDDTPLGEEYMGSDISAAKYTSSTQKRSALPPEKPKKKKTKSTATGSQPPLKIKSSPSSNRTVVGDKIKKERRAKTSQYFAASGKLSSSSTNDHGVRMMDLQREVPLLAPGERKHYLERAVQFVELHRAQLSRLEKSPIYVFLREVEGCANVRMENLASNWNSSIVRKQRIVGMSNVMLMARALQCLDRNLQRGDAMRSKRAVQAREDAEYKDPNGREEEEDEDDSRATSMKRYANTFNREYEQNYDSETAFEKSRSKGGVRYKVSDLDAPSASDEPSTTATYRYILPRGIQQSDVDESADNLQDDMADEATETAAEEDNEFPPEEAVAEPPQPLPRDVYQEVREYMTELRQYAQQLYMRNAATDVVREMLSAQHTGELETTGAFDAAVQQALMQAGQYNDKLDDAVLEDYLVDPKARCLMAQLVGHHITRNGLLAPRRDQKMVQLPANKASIQSVLAQMMYLEWRLDGVVGRQCIYFNNKTWHDVRRRRMESAMSFGGGRSGISRYAGARIDFASNHTSPGLYTYV